jgi:hypothetical protein
MYNMDNTYVLLLPPSAPSAWSKYRGKKSAPSSFLSQRYPPRVSAVT